ncbi:MAG: haloalkane dehalogenase [Actinomycetota bacterium]|jgi:haloalkane dehalogenase|nr:haloalkane dehalogenase [Actinomycetota bacterium]MDA3014834.1 haloalkane dehalogenase [Actinomycetota bacterium]MDA3028493.1 haloalkane dehalogenase [Actinomycetota bacterium]
MRTVRTPDERFDNLPGYAFAPNYVDIDDLDGGTLRVHYLDEGPTDGPVVLLMHGEPSWSYLYRNVIPSLVDAGHRVIAPDLVGFGRSDKPTEQSDYTYARHVEWMRQVVFDHLDLTDVTFFGQDWGGLVGLRLVALAPERYSGVVIGNTGLPTGRGPASDAFLAWQNFAATTEHFPVGAIINGGCTTDLAPEIIAAYDAPFPSDEHTAGARVFPSLVPTRPDDPATPDNDAAWEVLSTFDKPFLLAFSDSDPITRGGDAPFLAKVPGAVGQPHTTIAGGGHFLQEDRPADVAAAIRMVTGR